MASKALGAESPVPLAQGSPEEPSRRRQWGLLAMGAVGGALVALYAVVTPFLAPALRKVCLPFVPATSAQIQNVLKMLQRRSGSLADIGSGDGRVVSYRRLLPSLPQKSDKYSTPASALSYLQMFSFTFIVFYRVLCKGTSLRMVYV